MNKGQPAHPNNGHTPEDKSSFGFNKAHKQ
jgi:hypothetical protein